MYLPFSNKILSKPIPSNMLQKNTLESELVIFLLNDPIGVQNGAKICWYIAQDIPSGIDDYVVLIGINDVQTTVTNKYGQAMTVGELSKGYTYHSYYSYADPNYSNNHSMVTVNTPITNSDGTGCPTVYDSSSITTQTGSIVVHIDGVTLTSPQKICFRITQDIPTNVYEDNVYISVGGKECQMLNKYGLWITPGMLRKNYIYRGYYNLNTMADPDPMDQILVTNTPIETW